MLNKIIDILLIVSIILLMMYIVLGDTRYKYVDLNGEVGYTNKCFASYGVPICRVHEYNIQVEAFEEVK